MRGDEKKAELGAQGLATQLSSEHPRIVKIPLASGVFKLGHPQPNRTVSFPPREPPDFPDSAHAKS
eukprot:5157047-Pyramimonas_sp.AAC.1